MDLLKNITLGRAWQISSRQIDGALIHYFAIGLNSFLVVIFCICFLCTFTEIYFAVHLSLPIMDGDDGFVELRRLENKVLQTRHIDAWKP